MDGSRKTPPDAGSGTGSTGAPHRRAVQRRPPEKDAVPAASGARFAAAVEAMLDGFAIQTAIRDERGEIVDFRFDYVNEAAGRIFGIPLDEIVGTTMRTLFPGTSEAGTFAAYARAFDLDQPFSRDSLVYSGPPFGLAPSGTRAFDIRATNIGDAWAVSFRDVTDRKRAEDELFGSRQMLLLVLDTVPQRVFWKDTRGVYVGANRLAAHDAGFSDPVELIGKTDFDTNWQKSAARYRADDVEVTTTGTPKLNYLEEQVRPDGVRRWLRTSKVPLRDRNGKAIGVLGTYEDITDSQRAEEALRRSEQFLNTIIENIPDVVFVKDARDQRYLRCNRAAERAYGLSRDQMIGKTVYDLVPQAEAEAYAAYDRQALESRQPVEIPAHRLPGASRGRSLHTTLIPILDEGGEPLYLLGLSEDVTDRERAEEALRESEERYRNICETITDYVFTVRVRDGVAFETTHGPGCVPVTGYLPDELVANPGLWIEMVEPDDRPLVREQARRILCGEGYGAIEHRIVRKDGAVRWVRNTPVPQLDSAGALVAYDGLIQDITERRALQEQLLQAQKMEGIGRLAGGVAHDFNNLLTAILGYVELARADLPAGLPPDHPVRFDIEEVAAAGERAASLTRQLLAFASKQIVAPERLDLSVLVADSLNMLRRLLGENIQITTMLEPGIGAVEADPGQIQQLLVNLTVNARDAMPEGGRLTIETAPEVVDGDYASAHPGVVAGSYVRLSVTDSGTGMTDAVRSHLFEPFFTTKERGKGTGLGLATCHGIVKQMGGHIRVYSEEGQGTTFRIFLPMVGRPDAVAPAPALAEPPPYGIETVLVVEDEPSVRRLAVIGLRAQGYLVLEAANGSDALAIAERVGSQIDLVVSDVIMPGMSGPDLVRRLAEVAKGARALLMSGNAESEMTGGPEHDGLPFLPKPFTPERLARKVREVLDR